MDPSAGQSGQSRFRAPTGAALDWLVLGLLVVIWGSTFAGIRIAVKTIDPLWTVAFRMGLATAFLLVFKLVSRLAAGRSRTKAREQVTLAHLSFYAVIGVCFMATPFTLYSIAAQTTGSAVLAICNGATPFATAIAAHLAVGDRLTPRRIFGVALGFVGLALLVWPEATGDVEDASLLGVMIAIFGAVLYAGGNVGTRMAPALSPLTSSLILIGSGAVATLVSAALLSPFPQEASLASILAVLLMGLFPTGIAMILYVWLIRRAGAVFVSFTTYLAPMWATLIGVTLMDETLHWSMVGALALILAGVAVANARPKIRQAGKGAPSRPAA